MRKTICMLFLIRFGMVCYLPPLCAEEKVQVPGTGRTIRYLPNKMRPLFIWRAKC